MLSIVKRECCAPGQPLVVSIDGVDELVRTHPFADSEPPDLLKYLPTANELPEGVFVLLTRRPVSLPARVTQMLAELAPESHRRPVELTSEEHAAAQAAVIRTFVTHSLSNLWPNSPTAQRDELTAAILARSAGQFLKAQLLIDTFRWQRESVFGVSEDSPDHSARPAVTMFNPNAIGVGVGVGRESRDSITHSAHADGVAVKQPADIVDLPSPTSLPESEAIFSYALESLSHLVAGRYRDAEWFDHWHRAILGFVAAAFEPIRREHLRAWLPKGGWALLPVPSSSSASSTNEETGKSAHPPSLPDARPPIDRVWSEAAKQHLENALHELSSFVSEDRQTGELTPAHRELGEWLSQTQTPRWSGLLASSHQAVLAAADQQTWPADDDDESLTDEPCRYHLLRIPAHAFALNTLDRAEAWLSEHEGKVFQLGNWRHHQGRFFQAIQVWDILGSNYRELITHLGGEGQAVLDNWSLVNDLAAALVNCGVARQSQVDLSSAMSDYDQAERLMRRLIDDTFGGENAAASTNPELVVGLVVVCLNRAFVEEDRDDRDSGVIREVAQHALELLDKVFRGFAPDKVPPAWRKYQEHGLQIIARYPK